MEGELLHSTDLQEFIGIQCDKISNFIELSQGSINELSKDSLWISEHILTLLVKWSTGITETVIEQDILKSAGYIKKSSNIKADQSHITPAIHADISGIGLYNDTEAYVLSLVQGNAQHPLSFAVHGALIPFVNRFLIPGRRIHIANARFSNNIIIPSQLVVIDLKKTKEEVDFILNEVKNFSLEKITLNNTIPGALLVRVLNASSNGILVSDGSVQNPFEIYLEEERKALKLLLRFNDVIVMYRPDVRLLEPGRLALHFGPNTVIFRVPATGETKMTQLTQKASTLSMDGLLFRNSTSCCSINGVVLSISHTVESGVWTSSRLIIKSPNKEINEVYAYISQLPSNLHSIIADIRNSHFIWSFGLAKHEKCLTFTQESSIFDTNIMHGIISSEIAKINPLSSIDKYDSLITRAVIVKINCQIKHMHTVCQTIMSSGHNCTYCTGHFQSQDIIDCLVVRFDIDDGSSAPLEVVTTSDKIPFWGVSVSSWKQANNQKRKTMERRIIGQEFIFSLSLANESEFGGYTDSQLWRADICTMPVGDAQRHVKKLIEWHMKY